MAGRGDGGSGCGGDGWSGGRGGTSGGGDDGDAKERAVGGGGSTLGPSSQPNTKPSLGDVQKRAGLIWKAMSPQEKQPFHDLAIVDKERYEAG